MSLNEKINLPIDSGDSYPNVNNKSGEAVKISELIQDLKRSNTGQVQWTSPTSGITYKTSDSQNININNKGNTGLYNLLIERYGGNNGFMLTANDMNDIQPRIDETFSPLNENISQLSSKQKQVSISTNISMTQMETSNDALFDEIVSHYNDIQNYKYVSLEYVLYPNHTHSEANCGIQFSYEIPSSVLDISKQTFEVVGYSWIDANGVMRFSNGDLLSVVKSSDNYITFIFADYVSKCSTGDAVEGLVDATSIITPYNGRLKVLIRITDK